MDNRPLHVENILREGSYSSNSRLTPEELRQTLRLIDEIPIIDIIDIGPGKGLEQTIIEPGFPTEKYFDIVSNSVKNSGLSVMVHPDKIGNEEFNILQKFSGSIDQLRVAVDTNINHRTTKEFIRNCTTLETTVCLNLRKSHTVSPITFAKTVDSIINAGVDVVYIVDSAGCMSPTNVRQYVDHLQEKVDIQIGFHGHDNLGMAVQNALVAFDSGAEYIDSCLQSVGRSAGNTQTEAFFSQLYGPYKEDMWESLHQVEAVIHEVYPDNRGRHVEDIIFGMAGLSSSRSAQLKREAENQNKSYFKVLLEYAECRYNNEEIPNQLVVAFEDYSINRD